MNEITLDYAETVEFDEALSEINLKDYDYSGTEADEQGVCE